MHNSDRERLFSNLLNKDEHNSEDLAAPSSRYSNVDILLKKQSPLLSPKLKSRPASIHHPPQPNLNESDVPSRMLQAKLDSLQQENTSLRQNNDTRLLNDRINALIQENDVLVSQSKNYQMQLSTANHSNTTLSQDLKNLELMYNDAIQDLQKFESENHQLILKKEMFDRDSKQYSIEIENLNYNLNLVEGDYKKSVEEVKGLEERNLDLKKSLDVLTSRYEKCVDDGKMQFMRDRELMDAFKKVEGDYSGTFKLTFRFAD